MKAITKTNFQFPGQTSFYQGKVRDVYSLSNNLLVMVASDRISAFDVVLPKGIPGKGQVLNQIANFFLDATSDIVPNWKTVMADPMVTIGQKAEPFKVEMVIRGYLTGHAWRTYKSGERELCGVALAEGIAGTESEFAKVATEKSEKLTQRYQQREGSVSGAAMQTSQEVAIECLEAFEKNKQYVLCGSRNRFLHAITRLMSRKRVLNMVGGMFKRVAG